MVKRNLQNKSFRELKRERNNRAGDILLGLLKLFFGICLVPIAYALTSCFAHEFLKLSPPVIKAFIWGIVTFVGVHLFIWDIEPVFTGGKRLIEVIFGFFEPLVSVTPYVLPIYTLLLFLMYFIAVPFIDVSSYMFVFVFLLGFSFFLHIVYCARSLRENESDTTVIGYLFGFLLAYSLDVVLMAFLFNLAFNDFSFLNFFNRSYQITIDIYVAVFTQFFL